MLNGATLKEQRGGRKEGHGALCLLPGLTRMEARALVSNPERKYKGSGILQPSNTEYKCTYMSWPLDIANL